MCSPPSIAKAAALEMPLNIGVSCGIARRRSYRRLAVDLRGYARLSDGETFAIHLLDLSYDGCKVETALALLPGTKVSLCIAGLRDLHGEIRWCSAGFVGLCFGQVEEESRRESRRREKRLKLDAQVFIRHPAGASYPTRMFDFSRTGCRLELLKPTEVGETLKIRVEGWHALNGDLRWLDGFQGGVEFAKHIEPPIFQVLEAYLRRFCVADHDVAELLA